MDMLDTNAGTGASMIDNEPTKGTPSPKALTSSNTTPSSTTTTTTYHDFPSPWILPQPFGPLTDLKPLSLPEPSRKKATAPPSPDPRLGSRFSSETLSAATSSSLIPAGFRFQRLFSRESMALSPSSESSIRSYTRGHPISRSCDRIETSHGHGQGSCKEEILNTSPRSNDGKWGVGGIAKEVVETLKKRRQGSKSNESGRASPVDNREQTHRPESPALRMVGHALVLDHIVEVSHNLSWIVQKGSLDLPSTKPDSNSSTPRPAQCSLTRRAPIATGHRYSRSASDIVVPPPRSDSRTQHHATIARVAGSGPWSSHATPRRSPPKSSCLEPTPPPTRPLPARPISPPSISLGVRPLLLPARAPSLPSPKAPTTFNVFTPPPLTPSASMDIGDSSACEHPTFSAWVLERPDSFEIKDKTQDVLLVKLNIGGEVHLTTLATLTSRNRAGKLGEFVQAAVKGIRARFPETEHAHSEPSSIRSSSAYASSFDDGESIILNASYFAASKSPSPLPDEEHCRSRGQPNATIAVNVESFREGIGAVLEDDGEVMDPFLASHGHLANKLAERKAKLFLPLPTFTTPPLAVQHHPQLCKTPSPKARIHSSRPQVVRPESTLEFGTDSDDEIESQSTSITLPSLGTRDMNLFERRLKSQLITEMPLPPLPAPAETSSKEKAQAQATARREVKSVPVDVLPDENDDDEAIPPLPQRVEFLIPRLSIIGRTANSVDISDAKQAIPLTGESDMTAAEAPLVFPPPSFLDTTKIRSPPPNLAKQHQSSSQVLTIFLDRPSSPYFAILSYLRSAATPTGKGVLPPSLTFPSPSAHPYSTSISTTSPAQLDRTHLDLLHLSPSILMHRIASLRELAREARFLGMSDLLELVEKERSIVVHAARLLKAERQAEKRKEREKRGGACSNTSSPKGEAGTPPVARKVESVLRERKAAGWI
ncbi:BQ2448_6422 [Microbotryum intermedium]|uniref:BQ2448_6422 protein n=1 Tax=Microbotryum intermedium TaxID=269621 RepID=A0A238FJN2_9BASI|nr:BQ2448_6422 [Microbotryum intermedium]